jgi:hypothetical protein
MTVRVFHKPMTLQQKGLLQTYTPLSLYMKQVVHYLIVLSIVVMSR